MADARAYLEAKKKRKIEYDSSYKEIVQDIAQSTKDKSTDETDPVFKYLEKAEKYLSIVMKFFEGFNDRRQDAIKQQGGQQQPKIQAPEGWINLSPTQRMSRKYDGVGNISAWYRAGEAYEKEAGTYRPVKDMSAPPQRLQDLNNKYQEPQAVQETPASMYQGEDKNVVQENSDKNKQNSGEVRQDIGGTQGNEVARNDQERPQENQETERGVLPEIRHSSDQSPTPSEGDSSNSLQNEEGARLIMELNKDAQKYLEMMIFKLKEMKQDKFEKYLLNPENLYIDLRPYLPFLPFQAKELIRNITPEDFYPIFKQACEERSKWIEENNKVEQFKDLLRFLKTKI